MNFRKSSWTCKIFITNKIKKNKSAFTKKKLLNIIYMKKMAENQKTAFKNRK